MGKYEDSLNEWLKEGAGEESAGKARRQRRRYLKKEGENTKRDIRLRRQRQRQAHGNKPDPRVGKGGKLKRTRGCAVTAFTAGLSLVGAIAALRGWV